MQLRTPQPIGPQNAQRIDVRGAREKNLIHQNYLQQCLRPRGHQHQCRRRHHRHHHHHRRHHDDCGGDNYYHGGGGGGDDDDDDGDDDDGGGADDACIYIQCRLFVCLCVCVCVCDFSCT